MTNTATTAHQALLSGRLLTTFAGRVRISLQQIRPGVFNITTQQGTERVAEWSCSYGDADVALAERDRAAKAFDAFGTDLALEAEYHRLAVAIEAAEDRRRPTGNLHTRRDAIQPLTGAARDAELAARILGTIHAAQETGVMAQPPEQRRRTWKTLRDEFAATHTTSN